MKRESNRNFWALKSLFRKFLVLSTWFRFISFFFFFFFSFLTWSSSWLRADHHSPLEKGKQDRNETRFFDFFSQVFNRKGGTWSKGAENSPETWEKVSKRDWLPKMPKTSGYLKTPWPWILCDLINHVCWNFLSDCSKKLSFLCSCTDELTFPHFGRKADFSSPSWTSE